MVIISNIAFNIVDSFIVLVIFIFLNQITEFPSNNMVKSIIFISLYTLMLTFAEYFIPQGIRLLFNIIYLSLLLSLITKTSIYASVISNALIYIFFFTLEIAVLFIFMIITKMDMDIILNTLSTRVLCGIITKGSELLLVILFVKSGFKFNKLLEFKKPNTLFPLLTLQTLMIAVLIMSLSSVDAYKSNITLYNIFIVAVYLLLLVLTLIDHRERERLQAIQNRFKVQDEYINNMENILTIIRREKHDFANHLNTILAMCTLNKQDTVPKIGNYIRKLSVKMINAYHFYNSGNDYVDGMLAVKSNFAFEHGIKLDADFKSPLKNILINDCDITSIIGNITDNAFDAIIALGESEGKMVNISTYEDGLYYFISISNNGPVISDKDMSKIFNSGYSTKSCDKSDHGFGLYIVQQLVQRYNGMISVFSAEEKTEFLIRFFKDGKVYGKTG